MINPGWLGCPGVWMPKDTIKRTPESMGVRG